jgi:hypothetical protein|tara:strand:- start:21 stop:509 length:489 start_codon:yes stop_codon:yes gene_type:complete
MGRDAAEAKLQKELDKLRKKAKKTNKSKPLNMGREAVEKRRMDELDRIRIERKIKKNKANIKGRSNATMGGPSMLTQKDDYKKEKSKPKGIKGKVVELKMFKGEIIPKEEYDLIMATRKALGKNMGGMMKKKSMGYNKGGMSKKGMSDYRAGGMFYSSKNKK